MYLIKKIEIFGHEIYLGLNQCCWQLWRHTEMWFLTSLEKSLIDSSLLMKNLQGKNSPKFPNYKVGCVFLMVITSIVPLAEFGPNDHRGNPPHFSRFGESAPKFDNSKTIKWMFSIRENPNETELIQRINTMFTKFAILEITHEEYCIMKLINFLNHG